MKLLNFVSGVPHGPNWPTTTTTAHDSHRSTATAASTASHATAATVSHATSVQDATENARYDFFYQLTFECLLTRMGNLLIFLPTAERLHLFRNATGRSDPDATASPNADATTNEAIETLSCKRFLIRIMINYYPLNKTFSFFLSLSLYLSLNIYVTLLFSYIFDLYSYT